MTNEQKLKLAGLTVFTIGIGISLGLSFVTVLNMTNKPSSEENAKIRGYIGCAGGIIGVAFAFRNQFKKIYRENAQAPETAGAAPDAV